MFAALVLGALAVGAAPPITVEEGAMAVVSLAVDGGSGDAGALDLRVDGEVDSQVLFFPGLFTAPRAVVGPLSAGEHHIAVDPSPLWRSGGVPTVRMDVEVVPRGHPDYEVLRWAPRLGLRTDTIGTANDMPLILYVQRAADGRSRYSVIFSNEDGGTPARALMARWGRTADIEWVAETWMEDGRRRWTFQGPDHEVRRGSPDPEAITVVVSSLNNIFLATGASRASVRLVPRIVDLEEAARESLLDAEPWTYAVIARELVAEGKIDPRGRHEGAVADPRHHTYAEARVRLHAAAAAAWVETSSGRWRSSHHGSAELAVTRQGWIRTAVDTGTERPSRLAWECLPLSPVVTADAGCEIEATRLFQLDEDHRPGPNLVRRTTLRLEPGEMAVVSLPPDVRPD